MADGKVSGCFDLRTRCLVIGYWNLVVIAVDIVLLLAIAAIVSDGFQCDITRNTLERVDWVWLEPFLMVLNLGTHGFYAFPMTLWYSGPLPQTRRCYPGMVHAYLIDLLVLLINIIWMKFVLAFISSIYKKDLGPMRMFLHLSLAKLILQVIYLTYGPPIHHISWLFKICDIAAATGILLIINSYVNTLRKEKLEENADTPPPYVDASHWNTLMETKKPVDDVTDQHCLNDITVVPDTEKPVGKNDETVTTK